MPDEPENWKLLSNGSGPVILLGLGPGDPHDLPFVREAEATGKQIFWLETSDSIVKKLPQSWHKADYTDISGLAPLGSVYFYGPGLRLAPDFWGPLLARISLEVNKPQIRSGKKLAWLPGNDSQLLHRDLHETLSFSGYEVIESLCTASDARTLFRIWHDSLPDLAISVNFRGLDSEGYIFELCHALALPLAIWLVDNPWNLLSGIALPWWKRANLFVTDASFIEPLKAAGAKNVWYLPLAASPHMVNCQQTFANKSAPVFVGSSAFAKKRKFFSGVEIAPDLRAKAAHLAGLPDFHWWQQQYKAQLWPGKGARLPAFGADEFSALRRASFVREASKYGINIIGDTGWHEILPEIKVLPAVDYYGGLAEIYAQAECVLNVTSLLLPQSLNQRHFDVWAAGGFLFTDYTKGLEIFPSELVKPLLLKNPDDFAARLDWLRTNSNESEALAKEWRSIIVDKHTYEQRLKEIKDKLAG